MKTNIIQKRSDSTDLPNINELIRKNSHPDYFGDMFRPACVFLLFCNRGELHIPAILKADNKGYPWANQVALPGGHIDPNDTGPLDTAYRELEEEMGITRPHVDCFGSMGHYMTINNTQIEVFAGLWDEQEPIRYDRNEIARVIDIPVNDLIKTHFDNGLNGRIPGWDELLYPVEDVVVWGVTARILHYFIELVYA